MKLMVKDQLHVSSVQADTLRPGQEIEVSDALGKELLVKHPGAFAEIKAAKAPRNKAKPAHADKAANGPKPEEK